MFWVNDYPGGDPALLVYACCLQCWTRNCSCLRQVCFNTCHLNRPKSPDKVSYVRWFEPIQTQITWQGIFTCHLVRPTSLGALHLLSLVLQPLTWHPIFPPIACVNKLLCTKGLGRRICFGRHKKRWYILIYYDTFCHYSVLKRAGAEYGLSLSWSLLVASCMAFVMLEASARLVYFSIHLFSAVLLSWDELNLCWVKCRSESEYLHSLRVVEGPASGYFWSEDQNTMTIANKGGLSWTATKLQIFRLTIVSGRSLGEVSWSITSSITLYIVDPSKTDITNHVQQ